MWVNTFYWISTWYRGCPLLYTAYVVRAWLFILLRLTVVVCLYYLSCVKGVLIGNMRLWLKGETYISFYFTFTFVLSLVYRRVKSGWILSSTPWFSLSVTLLILNSMWSSYYMVFWRCHLTRSISLLQVKASKRKPYVEHMNWIYAKEWRAPKCSFQ